MMKDIVVILADAIVRVERAGDGEAKKREASQIIKQNLARIADRLPIPLFIIDLFLPYVIDWIVAAFNRIGALNGNRVHTRAADELPQNS